MPTTAQHPLLHALPAAFGADALSLSFESAQDLPSRSWQPPTMALLQLGDEPPEVAPTLALGAVEAAWADTVRVPL